MIRSIQQRGGAQKHWQEEDFDIIQDELGVGSYGAVYLAREKETKFVVALKVIHLPEDHPNIERRRKYILREIDIQSRLVHPFILRLYNIIIWEGEMVMLILEFAGKGEVEVPEEGLPPEIAARYISQLARALQYCHDMNIIHRDIKPANLLLDVHGNIKLADFGLSIHSPSQNPHGEQCGSLPYYAPEIIKSEPYWSKVDNWALGVLLYELLFFFLPYDPRQIVAELEAAQNPNCPLEEEEMDQAVLGELVRRIEEDAPPFQPCMVEDKALADLIFNLLEKDPGKRITLKKVLQHEWILRFCRC